MPQPRDEDLFEATKMTFGEHLEELRRALFKAIAALVVGFLVGLLFAGQLVEYVQTPLRAALIDYYSGRAAREYQRELAAQRASGEDVPADLEQVAELYARQGLVAERRWVDARELVDTLARRYPEAVDRTALANDDADPSTSLIPLTFYLKLIDDPRIRSIGLSVHEPFVVFVKAALVLGVILASPLVFYFIWEFVGAGLYPHEKRYVHIFLPFSQGLFLAGAALAFFVVFEFVLKFLFSFYDWMAIDPTPRISDWMNFVLLLPLGFGISFQLPLVMLFLERIGVFSIANFLAHWRIAVLVICVLSMLLTPADPQSMVLMAVPLVVLYFGGILLCRLMPRRTTPFGDVIE